LPRCLVPAQARHKHTSQQVRQELSRAQAIRGALLWELPGIGWGNFKPHWVYGPGRLAGGGSV
ncbi:MAG: hypothetical protein ACYS29_01640, partial [Planctomycetota bacterium]